MKIKTMSSREFNQSASEAKRAALSGPVFVTDRGAPSHVLLSIDEFRRLTGGVMTLAEALAQEGSQEIEFEPPKVANLHRSPDLS